MFGSPFTVYRSLGTAFRAVLFVVALTGVFLYTRVGAPTRVEAATSSSLNFQARLLTNGGSIVPDGTYNVEFKLYDSLAAGASAQGVCVGGVTDDCLWLETRTGANKVTVKNGYLSVHLGDVTGFPSTINWDQDTYLSMRIGGSGAPSWDTEMAPRLKLTSVPYAFRAAGLTVNDGANNANLSFASSITNNPDIKLPNIAGTNNVLLQSGTTLFSQGSIPFTDANGRLTQDNGNFFFDDTNNRLGVGNANPGTVLDISGALTVRGIAAPSVSSSDQGIIYFDSTADIFKVSQNGGIYYDLCTTAGNCAGAGGGITGTGTAGYLPYFDTNNTLAISYVLQGASDITLDDDIDFVVDATDNTFTVDAQNNRVGIGTSGTPSALLSVGGTTGNFTVDAAGAITGATGVTTTGNITQTGAGTFSTGTGAISLNGATTVTGSNTFTSGTGAVTLNGNTSISGANTLTVGTGATVLGGTLGVTGNATFTGTLTVNGSQFTNNGSTLNTAASISDVAAGGDIGTAATTVDVDTTFNINQTTVGQTLTLPTPTSTTAGRLVYVVNVGTEDFTMYNVVVKVNGAQAFIWNGSAWLSANIDGAGTGITGTGANGRVAYFNSSNTLTSSANFLFNGTDLTLGGDLNVNGGNIASTTSLDITASNGAVTITSTGAGNDIVLDSADVIALQDNTNITGNLDVSGTLTVGSANQLQVDASGNLDTTGNIEGAILNATTGFRVNGAAATGTYLRGNGTNFVGSALLASDLSGTIFNTAADTGTGTITTGETVTVQGGTNGIDTSLSGDTFTLNLDTTEIGTTTFGSGSGFTWTFDAGATDPTFAFANNLITVTAADTNFVGNLDVSGTFAVGSSNQFQVDASGNTQTSGTLQVASLASLNGGLSVARTLGVDSGTTQNVGNITFTTPADTTGTNVSQGLNITPTIGNATGGTNTANIINIAPTTGDAQVSLNALNIGALTGTAANEYALNIGSGWDSILRVNGVEVINGSGQIVSTQINGTLFSTNTDSASPNTITQGDTLLIQGGTTGIDVTHSGDTMTVNLDTTEISNATFGTGTGFTWTYDVGAVDPTVAFASDLVTLTAASTVLSGNLAVNGGSITSTTNLTVDANGYVRIGDTGTPGFANADDDLYIEGDLEVDANTELGGTLAVVGTSTFTGLATFNGGVTVANNSNFTQTGTGTFSTGTGAISLNGNTTVTGTNTLTVGTGATTLGGTLGVTGLATFNGGLTVVNGQQLTNAGSSLYSAQNITNKPTGGDIGTAATTVDTATTFNINQTTAGQTLTLDDPTDATAGRVVFVNNVGSVDFLMYGVSIGAGRSQSYIWNGTAWTAAGVDSAGAGVTSIGALDGDPPKSANGAHINSNVLYLQTADASFAGLVSTTAQTFAGDKTFNGQIIASGGINLGANTLQGTTAVIDFTNFDVDASGNVDAAGTLTAGTGNAFQVSSAGAVTAVGVNSGTGLIQGTGGLTVTGATNVNATGSAATNIGTGTGNVSVGNTTGTLTLSGASVLLNTATISRTAAGATTLDLVDGGNTTLALINSGAGVANFTTDGNITASGNVQGVIVNATTGFRVNGAAATGSYLRGDGTNFISSALLASDLSGTIFSTAADSGSGTLTTGETITISGGTNGIDTVLSGDTYTLNLDTTEIGSTTFGSGSGFTWTFDAGATDPQIGFASDAVTVTAGTVTLTGDLVVQGGAGTFGASGQAGTLVLYDGQSGGSAHTITLGVSGTLAQNSTITFPDPGGASANVCYQNDANCGFALTNGGSFVQFTPASAQSDASAFASIFINDTGGGNLIHLQSGGADQFVVANNGDTTISGALTADGAITFDSLNAGLVLSDANGLLSSGAVDRNSTTYFNTTLTVANGGTGAGTFTSNGVIYGNGTGALQVTAAGTSGQVLIANGSGVPTFVTFSGDVTVSSTGVTTIGANTVVLGTDTVGDFVNDVAGGLGLAVSGTPGEGFTETVSFDYTATLAGNPVLNAGESLFGTTGVIFEGATANNFEVLLTVTDPTADRTITLPNVNGTVITTGNLTDITAVGTVASGTWNGTAIGSQYGGTGQDFSGSTGVPTISSGTWSVQAQLPVSLGGTGTNTLTSNGVLLGNGTSAISAVTGTSAQVLIANGSGVPTFTTFTGDVTVSATGVTTIGANTVTLGTDTVGDFVNDVAGGLGLAVSGTPGEGFTETVSFDYTATLAGNPALATGQSLFGSTGIIFEGATADGFETLLTLTDPTADRTITLPNVDGTVITTGNLTQITAVGTIASGTWQGTAIGAQYGGTGINTSASTGVPTISSGTWSVQAQLPVSLGGTGRNTLTAQGLLVGDGTNNVVSVTGTSAQILVVDASGDPDFVTMSGDVTVSSTGVTTIGANTVALGTDTTGNYVGNVSAGGLGIDVSGTPGEGYTETISFDYSASLAGNPALNTGESLFGDIGVIFEGATADTFETLLTVTDPTADRTITLPNVDGTVITTGNLTQITAVGTVASGTWQGTAIGSQYGGTGQNFSGSTGVPTISSGTWSVQAQLPVSLGGTGRNTLTAQGLLVGDGTNNVVSVTGTSAQILVVDASGNPDFVDMTGDVTVSNTGVTTIGANTVTLGTDTVGNFVNDVAVGGLGLAVNGTPGEGFTETVSFDYTASLAGNPALNVGESLFGDLGVIFEGATANSFETLLTVTDPTADRTITLPNVDGTVITTGNLTQITAVGTITSGVTITNTSTTALRVQNAGGTETVFNIDTTTRTNGGTIKVGDSTGTDLDTTIFQLDGATANITTNLSSLNGGLYFNDGNGTAANGRFMGVVNNIADEFCIKTLANCSGGSGGIGGSGTNGQVAYFNGTNTITSSSNFTWDGSTLATAAVLNLNTTGSAAINVGSTSYSGTISIGNASSTTNVLGTVNINNTGAGTTNVGTGTGNTTVGNTTGTLTLQGASATLTTGNVTLTNDTNFVLSGGVNGFSVDGADNTFSVDGLNNRVGIGNIAPAALFSVGSSSQLQVDASGNTQTSGTLQVTSLSTLNGGLNLNKTLAVDSAGTQNVQSITFATPADTTGTNVSNGLNLAPTIGNATGGTNTANIINIAPTTGDAQVTLNALNIGALTGTAATEYALNIGSGWDSVLRVGGTEVINGSGQIVSTGITGTLFSTDTDTASANTIVQGDTLLVQGTSTGIDVTHSGDTITVGLDTTEITNATFGTGSGFTWTYDVGAVDPTIAFASDLVTLTAATTTLSGDLNVNGGDIRTAAGALTVTPASGSNFNVNLATTGDFVVNTDDLIVDTSSGFVGISTTGTPSATLSVGGTTGNFTVDGATGNTITSGTLAVNGDAITSDGATLTINAGGAVDIQDAVTADSLTLDTGSLTFSGVATDITTGANEDLVVIANGTGFINLDDIVRIGTLASADTDSAYLCRDASSGQLSACNTTGDGVAFVQGGNDFGANAVLGTNGAGQTLSFETAGTTRLTLDATGSLTFQQASTISTSTGALTVAPAAGASLNINLSTTGDLVVNTNDLVVDTSAGFVGIGTATPGVELDVIGDIQASHRIYIPGASGTSGQGYYTGTATTPLAAFQSIDAGSTFTFFANNKYWNGTTWVDNGLARNGASFQVQNDVFTYYSFNTGITPTARFTIATGGNVGITDVTPDAKLEVLATSEQLRLSHTDNTVDSRFTVDASGNLNIDNTGTKTVIVDDLQVTGNDLLDSAGTTRLTLGATNAFTGDVTTTGTLAVNGDSITADGATLTINAGGAVDIQDALTADSLTLDTAGLTFGAGVATDITNTGNDNLTVQTAGTGFIDLNDTVRIGTLAAADTDSYAVCRDTSTGQLSACDTNATGTAFLQGGNSFGVAADLGTNDTFALNFRTDNATRLTLSTTGDLTFAQSSTIGVSASNGTLTLNSNGTGAINVDSTGAGTVNIGTGSSTAVNVGTGATAKAVSIGNTTGATSVVINSGTGNLTLATQGTGTLGVGNNAVAQNIAVGNVTGATQLNLRVGTGNFTLDGVAGSTYSFGASTTTGTILIGGTAQTGAITLGSSTGTNSVLVANGSGDTTVSIANVATNAVVNIATASTSGAITIGGSGNTSTLTLQTGTGTIDIGTTSSARSINIGTGAAAQTVVLGSTDTTSTTTVNAGTGGVSVQTGANGSGASGAASLQTGSGTTGTGGITIATGNASAGTSGNISINNGTSSSGTPLINIGTNGVANTIQIGNTTGAVAQTINIGNNATASSATTLLLGSTIGTSTTTLQSGSGGIVIPASLAGTVNTSTYLCRNSSNQLTTCLTTGDGAAFVQGGNDFGANAVLGTNGAGQTLSFETAGTTRLTIDATGNFALQQATTISTTTGALTVAPASGSSLLINLATTGDLIVNTDDLVVDTSTGNVGVGDTDPAYQFTVGTGDLSGITSTGAVVIKTGGAAPTADLSFGTGANRTINVLAQTTSNTAGNNLTLQAATGNGTGTGGSLQLTAGIGGATAAAGGEVLIQGGAAGAGGTVSGSVIVRSNGNNKTTAFLIQKADSSAVFTVDTVNTRIIVGAGAGTLANRNLDVAVAEITSQVHIGGATNYIETNATTGQLRYSGDARNTKVITLMPEFPGAVLTGDGANNTGTMTSDFCINRTTSPALSINVSGSNCGTDESRNYYSWTAQATNDYDVWLRWQVPSDFSSWTASNPIQFYGWRSSSSSGTSVTMTVYSESGAVCGSATSISNTTTWTATNYTSSGCSPAAGATLIIRITLSVGVNNEFARIGEIKLNYLSSF